MKIKWLVISGLSLLISACSSTPCKNPAVHPQNDQKNNIWVYKYSGSLTCEKGSGLTIEAMENELKGIKVIDRANKNDGKIRPMVCGIPSGSINTYLISRRDFEKAEKRGFKKLEELESAENSSKPKDSN